MTTITTDTGDNGGAFRFMDTLKFSKELKRGGFTDQQAEMLADKISGLVVDGQLVTRQYLDLKLAEVELKISEVKHDLELKLSEVKRDLELKISELKLDIAEVKRDLELKISEVKSDLLKWLVPMLIGQTAVTVALIKFL